jgi:DNA-directed RNA polymerase specialized sigma24 family protein
MSALTATSGSIPDTDTADLEKFLHYWITPANGETMSDFQPTILALGSSTLDREELTGAYKSLEGRAVSLFEGWENVLGETPDDLAQTAWFSYHRLRTSGHEAESARKLASKGLREDYINLMEKRDNNPQEYFSDDDPEPLEDEFDDPGEAGLESRHESVIYFSPDQMDWMADRLTPRELEAVILVFEDDLTHVAAAKKMHVGSRRVDALVKSSVSKLREEWATSH